MVDLARLRSLQGIKWAKYPDSVLPAWVADMDFAPPPAVTDAIAAMVERGDLGYNFVTEQSNGSLFWETDFHFEDDESRTISAGPALYFNHNDTIHSRIEWKHDFADHQGILDHGNGDAIKLGVAWVF